mmetsp:Transcript_23223/g.27925  ORF Transcript_23223/g.27925 Transcript_23223/m.27925 type:complete len:262 (-) Transcript_23223:40-825(-)|eukprot:CAMPEP_0197286882 /NCGR_PEP_ID=MMETSP0890-20130614/2667_1 /TAXON_ID=44058 ORGANISM="Aureoumbra lagunensis, Strain CCMP1510" /NCGR_SAMPLE_ID=MMETSP0890 /ASSEMBLY_ACC=CAM_ASM_000533 /LENGTH=261 /DNA_ID=CAMNT_0042755807 /DNA_START=130 /DNA_END=915 /DNA_ORIENTATION=+
MKNDDEELGESYDLSGNNNDDEEETGELAKPQVLSRKKEFVAIDLMSWEASQWSEWLLGLKPEEKGLAQELGNRLTSPPKTVSGPGIRVLIICGSAVRAAKIASYVQGFKLFGKHLKVQDQLETLSKGNFPPVAVGTPARLEALLSALRNAMIHGTHIIIDASPDAKKYTPLSLPDAKHPLARFLLALLDLSPRFTLSASRLLNEEETGTEDDGVLLLRSLSRRDRRSSSGSSPQKRKLSYYESTSSSSSSPSSKKKFFKK